MDAVWQVLTNRFRLPKDTKPDFSGRIVIVTGANTGIGIEAALKFVQLGAAKVILTSRSQEKGNAAKDEIEKRTGRKGVAEVWPLDMLDYDSIKAFAKRAETLDHLDIVVLNAGVISLNFEQSQYGWERTLQVNVISTVALATLLLPKLKQSKKAGNIPVLEIIDSGSHVGAQLAPEVINGSTDVLSYYNDAGNFSSYNQYGVSKLLLMFAVQQLASLVVNDDNTYEAHVVAVCPGPTKSEISRDSKGFLLNLLKPVVFSIFRTGEEGSRTYISGITLGEKGHGRFWMNDEIQPQKPLLIGDTGKALQKRVCSSIVEALKTNIPEASSLTKS